MRTNLTLDAALGVENNFDALRFFAALGVVLSHAYPVTQGSNAHEILMVLSRGQTTLGDVCVMAFFAISGFLITQSFARSEGTIDFMTNRVLRLVPGLTVMALLTSFVLGSNVTSLAPEEYWSSLATCHGIWSKSHRLRVSDGLHIGSNVSLALRQLLAYPGRCRHSSRNSAWMNCEMTWAWAKMNTFKVPALCL